MNKRPSKSCRLIAQAISLQSSAQTAIPVGSNGLVQWNQENAPAVSNFLKQVSAAERMESGILMLTGPFRLKVMVRQEEDILHFITFLWYSFKNKAFIIRIVHRNYVAITRFLVSPMADSFFFCLRRVDTKTPGMSVPVQQENFQHRQLRD